MQAFHFSRSIIDLETNRSATLAMLPDRAGQLQLHVLVVNFTTGQYCSDIIDIPKDCEDLDDLIRLLNAPAEEITDDFFWILEGTPCTRKR